MRAHGSVLALVLPFVRTFASVDAFQTKAGSTLANLRRIDAANIARGLFRFDPDMGSRAFVVGSGELNVVSCNGRRFFNDFP